MLTDAKSIARFGIIACSNIARRRFLPALLSSQCGTLERFGSRTPAKARAYANEFNCAKTGSYEDVLRDASVNCVYISTPPALHKHWIMEAARHGKHVLCEKPAAMSMQDAIDIVDCCRENNVCFLEGYSFLFHPQHEEFRERIRNGAIGKPRFFTGQFTYPSPAEGDYRLQHELGGGVFFDSAGYPVAAALMTLGGNPVMVFAHFEYDEGLGIDVGVAITLIWRNGETAQLHAGMDMQYRSKYAAHGAHGRIELERAYSIAPSFMPALLIENKSGTARVELQQADQFRIMIEHFVDGFNDKRPRIIFEERFLRQQTIMQAAFLSAQSGKPHAPAPLDQGI